MAQQNESLSLACGCSTKANNQDSDLYLAKMWTNKLKTLDSTQRIFAEKAINDVLFEAQLGTLNRNSVQISPQSTSENNIRPSTASTSFSHSSTPSSHTCTEHSTNTSTRNISTNTSTGNVSNVPLSETKLHSYFTNFYEETYE